MSEKRPPPFIWHYITDSGLKSLSEYAYSGTDLSILVELFLRSFWNWCMRFMPIWIAPNLVTTIGFIFLISNYLLGVGLCSTSVLTCSPPSWYFLLAAFNTFFYQLMDNLDGKQARRTKSSSALGELFDHGCDSLFILSMTICLGTGLGMNGWEVFILLSFGSAIFYASHWEEYHTHHLILGRYANPTEAQVGMMILLVIAGIFGPSIYTTPLFRAIPNVPSFLQTITLTKCVVVATFFGCLYTFVVNSIKVTKWTNKHKKSFLYGFSPIIPVILLTTMMGLWAYHSKSNIVENSAIFLHLFIGITSSYMCNELVVCRITKMNYFPLRPILVLPLIGLLNISLTSVPLIQEEFLLRILLAILCVVYLYFIVSVTFQLTYCLGIYVFWIPPPPPELEQPKTASSTS